MIKYKTKIYYLPTKDIANVVLYHKKRLVYFENPVAECVTANPISQHAYATVSQEVDPIKEGCYLISDNKVYRVITTDVLYSGEFTLETDIEGVFLNPIHCRKIIATTDKSLGLTMYTCKDCNEKGCESCNNTGSIRRSSIAQFQQSFLKEFVDNPDGEYEVEYERVYRQHGSVVTFKAPIITQTMHERGKSWEQLKLNQDTEVNITSVEDAKTKFVYDDITHAIAYGHSMAKQGLSHHQTLINYKEANNIKYVPVEKKMYSLEQVVEAYNEGYSEASGHCAGPMMDDNPVWAEDWINENL